tara:strand:+ start:364 stop:1323 length:960 start_codon:yes stop_codon:yes gene_type:complete
MAYKQNFGRNNLTNANISALTNGGTDPETDPKPNGVVASDSDETFGSGVTNELPTVDLGIVKRTKPAATELSNEERSNMLRRQIIAGKGDLLDTSYLPNNPNITQTTATVTKNSTDGKTYDVIEDTFQNSLGGKPTVITQGNGNISMDNMKPQYYSNSEARTQVANSVNRQNTNPMIPGTSTATGSGRQNYMTRVTGGGDTGLPLIKEAQNVLTGDILGEISNSARPTTTLSSRNAATGFYSGNANRTSTNTPQLDGTERYINVTRRMGPEDLRNFVDQDSLGGLGGRRTTSAYVAGKKFKNRTFMNNTGFNITSGDED